MISIFIITLNEADRLRETLQAIAGLSDDVVVIDSGSTDGTQSLAEDFGARVIHHEFKGYGAQKRFGEQQCQHEWLLNIDADEVLTPALYQEIKTLITIEPLCDAYRIRIAEMFPGETRPHPWAYALAPVRLYKKSAGRYSPSPVHDRVDLQDNVKVGQLKGLISHKSVRSLGDQIRKLNDYSTQQANDLMKRGVTPSRLRLFVEFPAAFFKAYIGRRHFVRGIYGFLTAMNYAMSRHMRVAKHYEMTQIQQKKN